MGSNWSLAILKISVMQVESPTTSGLPAKMPSPLMTSMCVERSHGRNGKLRQPPATFREATTCRVVKYLEMAYGGEHYRVGRVYGANQKGARMRLSGDLTMLGREILNSCGGFPSGVELNGVTVSPTEEPVW